MHIASMSLGIFDFLIDWIASLVGTVIGWVFDIIMGIVNRMIFTIAKQILFIVDVIQALFRRLAGLDKYWIVENGQTKPQEGDILVSLMSNETVLEVLLTLTLVAVAMVIIATIIKIVQSEFTTEGSKNSKGSIIGQAIKSLVMFVLVPVLCFGGVFVSNALLKALDAATSQGSESSMASQIFVSAASSANKVRNGQISYTSELATFINGGNPLNNQSQAALAIDNAFRMQTDFKKEPPISAGGIVETVINTIFNFATGNYAAGVILTINGMGSIGTASHQNIYMVGTYYDIGQMNMIILIGGSIMACYVMIVTSFGLIMRLFKAVILFMVSPPIIAIAPLDKGNAFQSWRKQFIAEVLAAYGAVLGLNLFFIILPLLNNINVFPDFGDKLVEAGANVTSASIGGYGGNIFNDLAHLLFTLVGLYMLKDLIKMVGDIAGGSDAMGAGEGMAKKAGNAALKVGMAVATGGAALASGIGGAVAAGKATKAGEIGSKLAKNTSSAKGALDKSIAKRDSISGEISGLESQLAAAEEQQKGYKGNKKGKKTGHDQTKHIRDLQSQIASKKKALQSAESSVTSNQTAYDSAIAAENANNENITKLNSTASARTARAKGMAGNLLAEGMGRISKGINGMFGTKLIEDTTVKGREDERDKRAEAAAGRIADGKGSGMDYATLGHKKKVAEISEAYQRGVQHLDSNNAQIHASKVALDGLDINDLAGATATAMAHASNKLEGEQSQQIWRGILEQIKQMNEAKKRLDSAAPADKAAAQNEYNTIKNGFNESLKNFQSQMNDIDLQSKIEVKVNGELKSKANASASDVEKAIKKAAQESGATQDQINRMTDQILQKIMAEISKIAPK